MTTRQLGNTWRLTRLMPGPLHIAPCTLRTCKTMFCASMMFVRDETWIFEMVRSDRISTSKKQTDS